MLRGFVPNITQMINETKPSVLLFSPTNGATVTLPNQARDMIAYITPAGGLLALTLALPSDASTIVGQTISVFLSQPITVLTTSNVLNAPVSLVLNSGFEIMKVATNTWVRL